MYLGKLLVLQNKEQYVYNTHLGRKIFVIWLLSMYIYERVPSFDFSLIITPIYQKLRVE